MGSLVYPLEVQAFTLEGFPVDPIVKPQFLVDLDVLQGSEEDHVSVLSIHLQRNKEIDIVRYKLYLSPRGNSGSR